MLRRRKIKLNWSVGSFGLHLIPTRVDQPFRGTGDNGDVQHCKKDRVFPSSAIEHQDCIAGSKSVGKHFPYGSALGTDPRT